MVIKIINTMLILFAVCMGIKQGYAMLIAKPEMPPAVVRGTRTTSS